MLTLAEKLNSPGFDPKTYVNELTSLNPGVETLLLERQRIQSLADETNAQLKKNVFQNYTQFIDTAKEISHLEGEIFQLSHLLLEQQGVLNSLLDISITSGGESAKSTAANTPENDEENQKVLSNILEKVEGVSTALDVSTRHIVYSGKLLELNSNDLSVLNRAFAILLNDSLIIATMLPTKKGPLHYKYETLYELNNLAIVNVKSDAPKTKNCFKLLMFPTTRLFQCETAMIKSEWLKKIEVSKKTKELATTMAKQAHSAHSRTVSFRHHIEEEDEEEEDDEFPEWLQELPEDLDVLIAQRDFEGSVSSIKQAENYFAKSLNKEFIAEMSARIEQRKKHLVEILMEELKVSPDHVVQGGPRSARKAVSYLVKLEKSSQACELFLEHRHALLKHGLRQQHMEGATTLYIRRLSTLFFNNLLDTIKEFNYAFSSQPYCASSLVVWCQTQLDEFSHTFVKHVFTAQTTLGVAADCVQCIRNYCKQLLEYGLDLTLILDRLLHGGVERVITESRDKLLEAIKVRAEEDKWRPQNLQNKASMIKFVDEMKDIGIASISNFVFDECFISLTTNTTAFTKIYLHFLDDLMKLKMPYLYPLIVDSLVSIFKAQMHHFEVCYGNDKYKDEEKFIAWNARFLFDTVLNLAQTRFAEANNKKCTELAELHNLGSNYKSNLNYSSTTITKYSSTSFI